MDHFHDAEEQLIVNRQSQRSYVAYVADTTCRLRPPVSCLPDMSYDMSDMSSNVGATCRDVAPTEIAPKTRHVATSGD